MYICIDTIILTTIKHIDLQTYETIHLYQQASNFPFRHGNEHGKETCGTSLVPHFSIPFMKRFACILILVTLSPFSTQAQIKIDSFGRVIAGTNTIPYFDPDTVLTLSLQGKKAITNFGGTKLSFGDFGAWQRMGWNVFLGEYGNGDSDILWLHGKKGIRMTADDGNTVIGEFYCDDSSRVVIRPPIRTGGISVSSDDAFKYDKTQITDVIPLLKNLHAMSYRYIFPQDYTDGAEHQGDGCEQASCQSDKERADSARLSHIKSIRSAGLAEYGFLTLELESLFPEVVKTDAQGHKYVNYNSLIPIIVAAFQEQQREIATLQSALQELSISFNECCRMRSYLNGDDNTDDSDSKSGQLTPPNQPILYQNSPNPFNQTSTIEYHIPNNASSASIYIFTLNGVLMQSLPIMSFGHGQITINASALTAGMYIYSLTIDGQIVDTKRMILTE